MAITQLRLITIAKAADGAQLRLRGLKAELGVFSAQLGQAYTHSLPIDLPYIMGEVDRLASAFQTPEEERDLVTKELYHYAREAKNNDRRAANMAHRRYLLGHEDEGIRQSALMASRSRPQAHPTLASAIDAIAARGEAVGLLLAHPTPQGAPAVGEFPTQEVTKEACVMQAPAAHATTQLIDFGPPSAEELAGYAKWNAGQALPPDVSAGGEERPLPPTYVRHDSTGWASHIKRSEAGVELPEDLYSTDPLADPSADPFGGQDEAL